jgi:hypothetical protein
MTGLRAEIAEDAERLKLMMLGKRMKKVIRKKA